MNFNGARFAPPTLTQPGKSDYVYHDSRIVLAVNVALATRRPLLVTGPPGAGKSTLAADVARQLKWACISTTVTSRTQIEDLIARSDAVARFERRASTGREGTRGIPCPWHPVVGVRPGFGICAAAGGRPPSESRQCRQRHRHPPG